MADKQRPVFRHNSHNVRHRHDAKSECLVDGTEMQKDSTAKHHQAHAVRVVLRKVTCAGLHFEGQR